MPYITLSTASLLPCTFCCSITDGNTKCQLRLLDNFTIHEAGKPRAFVALEALRSSSRPVATGELLPAKSTDAGACGEGKCQHGA